MALENVRPTVKFLNLLLVIGTEATESLINTTTYTEQWTTHIYIPLRELRVSHQVSGAVARAIPNKFQTRMEWWISPQAHRG